MTRNESISYGIFGVACVLVSVYVILPSAKEGSVSNLIDDCTEMQGEWLHGAVRPTCITAEGEWLFFDQQTGAFAPLVEEIVDGLTPVPVVASAVTDIDCGEVNPDFSTYPAELDGLTRSVAADFSTLPAASRHRTAIGRDVSRGVNFAGGYVLAEWGCGEGCYGLAVVDAATGEISGYGTTSTQRFTYQQNSRLIGSNTREGLVYYVLNEEGDLEIVCNK